MATLTPTLSAAPTAATRPLAVVAAVQGVFYLATGVWPLVDITSFMAVTGPKTDLWLVQTVGVLIAVAGVVLLCAAWSGRVTPEVTLLAVGMAVALIGVDVVFVSRGVILPIYLADAVAEGILVLAWAAAGYCARYHAGR